MTFKIPTRLYHGTSRVFDSFNLENSCADSAVGSGIYMTTSFYDARDFYANPNSPDNSLALDREVCRLADELQVDEWKDRRVLKELARERMFKQHTVLSCEVKINNPFILSKRPNKLETVVRLFDTEDDEVYPTDAYHTISCYFEPEYDDGEIRGEDLRSQFYRNCNDGDFGDLLRQMGYDGVVMLNVKQFFPMYDGFNQNPHHMHHIVSLYPENVKIVGKKNVDTVEFFA